MSSGWKRLPFASFTDRVRDINVDGRELEPLSVTKDHGVILQSSRFKKRVATDLRKYQVVRRGDFVYDPMSLYYGSVGRLDVIDEGVTSPDYVVFRGDDTVDPDFLLFLLRWPRSTAVFESHSERGNRAGKRRRLYWSGFQSIAVDVPPLPEQRKIAAILSSVDEAIEATQAVIDQVQVVKKGLMQELLTKGLPGRHKKFKQTEIGQIPEEWEVVELGDVLERIESGWSPRCDSRAATREEWGVLKVSAVSWGRFRPEENKRLAEDLSPRLEAEVRPGDVILSRANTTALVGRPVLVEKTRGRLMLSDKTLRLVPTPRLDKQFLVETLLGPSARQQIEDKATGSSKSMKNISQGKLRSIRFPLPPIEEQQRISEGAATLASREEQESRSLARLSTLKSALASVLLTGKLRVQPAP